VNLEALGLLLLAIAEVAVVFWAIVDALGRPNSAWKRAGQNKILWVALQPVGLVYIIGLIIPAIYFALIRPSVRRAQLANSIPASGDRLESFNQRTNERTPSLT
jgi:hypothetical protein